MISRIRSRRGRVAVAMLTTVAVLGAAALTSPAAAATASWSRQSPPPVTTLSGTFHAVSCVTSTSCFAVGSSTSAKGFAAPLAERWNGSTWTITATPGPAGSSLSSVSCTSTRCVAVGNYPAASGVRRILIETWTATGWALTTAANPGATVSASLDAVSCSSDTFCVGAGTYSTSGGVATAFTEPIINGVASFDRVPLAKGTTASHLVAVSCWADEHCLAVGSATVNGADQPLIEEFDTGSWQRVASAQAAAPATATYLSTVSCVSSTFCAVLGYSVDGAARDTFGETGSSAGWTVWPVPEILHTSGETVVDSVSCVSATACVALAGPPTPAMAEVTDLWDGTGWYRGPNDNSGLEANQLSCLSTTFCAATGGVVGSLPAIDTWNGTLWSRQSVLVPYVPLDTVFTSVSCQASTSCVAVGRFTISGAVRVVHERWNGSVWALYGDNEGGSNADHYLESVSCTDVDHCLTVGHNIGSGGRSGALAEYLSGGRWSAQNTSTAVPLAATSSAFSGASCVAVASCVIVGTYTDHNGVARTLADTFGATNTFAVQQTADPPGFISSELDAVWCASLTSCIAVGSYRDATYAKHTLAELWDGETWTVLDTPMPDGSTRGGLTGVACTGAGSCAASGHYVNSSGGDSSLIESWNGSTWAINPSVDVPTATHTLLAAVSCSSASSCAAVGHDMDSNGLPHPVIEIGSISGSWVIAPAHEANGVVSSTLNGVSCSGVTACTAVGSQTYGPLDIPVAYRHGR